MFFGEQLRRLRIEKGLSQQQLAEQLYVDRSTLASWETGRRVPDAAMIAQLSAQLSTDVSVLLRAAEAPAARPRVILVDDESIILNGNLSVLRKAIPGAEVTGFTVPAEALAFARTQSVELAFLDIEMGRISGLDVCRELLEIQPRTNVVFVTAYPDYALDAWGSGACGFVLKPLTPEAVQSQLQRLRYPIRGWEQV